MCLPCSHEDLVWSLETCNHSLSVGGVEDTDVSLSLPEKGSERSSLKKVTNVWIMIGCSLASTCTPKSIDVHINLHEHTQKCALYFFLDICTLAPKNELFVHIHFNCLFIHCICILTNSQATQCLAEWTECGKKEKEKERNQVQK